ncbi:MAG: hypothetical protein AAF696_04285 [Bacteroidota bacterium]
MKTYHLLLISLLFLSFACEREEIGPIQNPAYQLNAIVEVINSQNDYTANIQSIKEERKTRGWTINREGQIYLNKQIHFEVVLDNQDTLHMGFWFTKYEDNRDLLILEDEDKRYWERNWAYKSLEDEAAFFYADFDNAQVTIENNVSFHEGPNENFRVTKIEEAIVNGENKNLVHLSFQGLAFGWYDPDGRFQEVYKFLDGKFSGVIE